MRNSTIVLTAAVAIVAGGLAWAVNQPGGLQSLLHNNTTLQTAPVNAEVNGTVTDTRTATAAPTAASNAAAMLSGNTETPVAAEPEQVATTEAASTPATPEAAQAAATPTTLQPDVTSTGALQATGETQTGGMTPADLDKASTRLNSEVPAAGTEVAPVATTNDAPTKTGDFKIDVDAAMVDRTIGSPAAPITVYDFSSLSCPHCAMFHNTILPQIKDEYIDKGLVRWVFKGFPLNEPALKAEMLARCAPDNQYIALEDMMYKNQERWAYTADPLPNLSLLVKIAGIDENMFVSCINNKDLETRLAKAIQDNAEKYKLTSTPTFVLNDGKKTIVGAGSFNGFAADLDYMLRQLKVEPPVHKIPASATEF